MGTLGRAVKTRRTAMIPDMVLSDDGIMDYDGP
jgi:hypothetical protein